MSENMISGDVATRGRAIYELARELFPICRSLTGNGVRQTLQILQREVPRLAVHEIPSGTTCFDWTVPPEWNIRDAYVADERGERLIDFQRHNLHVVGYSVPVDKVIGWEELDEHLHSLPEQPTAIPYVTSYYKPRWGFCLAHEERLRLDHKARYHVVIDSTLEPGALTYGELILPGRECREVLLSTYICHPSLANNELSGPVVTIALAQWLSSLTDRRLTYRILFVPETIGSIAYLSRHLEHMKKHTIAGFQVTCVGDDRCFSFLPSRAGDTLADRVAIHTLRHHAPEFLRYTFLDRGSDERQYCSVGANLPVVSVMRSKYGTYPEYHTSLDDLTLISPQGLEKSYRVLKSCLGTLEQNAYYRATQTCEPQLGKRGLYPMLSTKPLDQKTSDQQIWLMLNLLAYADGQTDVIDLAEKVLRSAEDCIPVIQQLQEAGLLSLVGCASTEPS